MKNCNGPPRTNLLSPFCNSGSPSVQVWPYYSHLLYNEYMSLPINCPDRHLCQSWSCYDSGLLTYRFADLLMTPTSAYFLSSSYCRCGLLHFCCKLLFSLMWWLTTRQNLILYAFIVIQDLVSIDTISMSNWKIIIKAMQNAWFFHPFCFFEQNEVLLK